MNRITTLDALGTLYGAPNPRSLTKVADRITPLYRQWIEAARFVVLSTVGPEGTDASPRGDDGPVVRLADDRQVLIPDWRGNNRLDSLRNIIHDPRVSLMFMATGSATVVRLNGRAWLTDDAVLRQSFAKGDKLPATVIVVEMEELYFQCAKAILRSRLWDGAAPKLPSAGDFLREQDSGFDAEAYDAAYPQRAPGQFW